MRTEDEIKFVMDQAYKLAKSTIEIIKNLAIEINEMGVDDPTKLEKQKACADYERTLTLSYAKAQTLKWVLQDTVTTTEEIVI